MTDAEFLSAVHGLYPKHVKVGKVTGQVRLYGPAWDHLRAFVWNRDGRRCVATGKPVILEKGHWNTMHLAHYKSKGSGGSDLPSNVRCLCLEAHSAEHHGVDTP